MAAAIDRAKLTVNQVISRRMVKHQQISWSRDGAQRLLDVRTQALNGTLEERFGGGIQAFRLQECRSEATHPTLPDTLLNEVTRLCTDSGTVPRSACRIRCDHRLRGSRSRVR
jgi:hypothetical protein